MQLSNMETMAPIDILERMVTELTPLCQRSEDILMIGTQTGGVWVAKYLHQKLGIQQPLAELNIDFYRDNFSRIGLHPRVTPSTLPMTIENSHILLVYDILFTGRTVRAAMNEIFDFGRPAKITLAVLIDRGGRELPIHADIVGQPVTLASNQNIKLSGSKPLHILVEQRPL